MLEMEGDDSRMMIGLHKKVMETINRILLCGCVCKCCLFFLVNIFSNSCDRYNEII